MDPRPPPPSRPSSVIGLLSSLSVVAVVRLASLPSLSSVLIVVGPHRPCRRPSLVLVGSSSPSPSSSERNSQLAVSGDDDVFVRRPCRASSRCPRRGAAWLLLCGRAARQCRWAFEEAATHLCRVVGAPPTRLGPSPPSSIAVIHRRRRRHPHGLANGPEPTWTASSAISRRRRRPCRCRVADLDGGRHAWPSR